MDIKHDIQHSTIHQSYSFWCLHHGLHYYSYYKLQGIAPDKYPRQKSLMITRKIWIIAQNRYIFAPPHEIATFSAPLHQIAQEFRNDPESLQFSSWKPRSLYLIPLFLDSLLFSCYYSRSPLFRTPQPQIGIIYSSPTRDHHFEI